jgi:hypothetical protein
MKTALRLLVCLVIAAMAYPVFARSPASNGTGDGEANVPFATMQEATIGADEVGGGSGEPGRATAYPVFARSPASNGTGDGEANVPFATMQEATIGADEVGGGSGEPGRAAGALDEAARAEADREFERHVWTDP